MLNKSLPQHIQVYKVPMIRCPMCLGGKMAHDDDGFVCANCGNIIYDHPPFPLVPKNKIYG